MELDIIDLYKVCAIIDIFSVIRKIVFIKRKPPNVIYYATHLFVLCAILGGMYTLVLMMAAEFSSPSMPTLIELTLEHRVMWLILLMIDLCITIALLILSGKYATYHIVYYPKKRKKTKIVNLDESYIIRHRLFGTQKIWVRDFVVEKSSYCMKSGRTSKIFPNAHILGWEEYLAAQLKNGKKVKIQNNFVFLSGTQSNVLLKLPELANALGIEHKHSKK